jgi:hypothetical protein
MREEIFFNEPSERGQIVQIGTKELERYEVRGPFRNDALWNFKPANYMLSGRITNFRVELPSDSKIADEAYPFQVMEKVVTREDRTVNPIEAVPETFLLQFLQSFKPFISSSEGEVLDEEEQEERVTINLKDLASKIPFLSQRKEYFETKAPFLRKSNTQLWISYGQMEHSIEQTFKRWVDVEDGPQAPPVKSLKVQGYCKIVKELEIPFTADLEVRLKSDDQMYFRTEKFLQSMTLKTRMFYSTFYLALRNSNCCKFDGPDFILEKVWSHDERKWNIVMYEEMTLCKTKSSIRRTTCFPCLIAIQISVFESCSSTINSRRKLFTATKA